MACNLVTSIGNHPMNVLKYFQILKFTRICIQYLLHSKDQKQKIRFYITTKLSNVLLAPAAVKAQSSEIISPFLNLSTIYFTFLFLFHLVSRLPSLISPTHMHPPLSCRLPFYLSQVHCLCKDSKNAQSMLFKLYLQKSL